MQVTTLIVATVHFAIAAAEMIHCIRRVRMVPWAHASPPQKRHLDLLIGLSVYAKLTVVITDIQTDHATSQRLQQ